MKKTKQLILNFALTISVLLTILFAIKWFYSDNSGEAAFAIFIYWSFYSNFNLFEK